MNDIKIDAKFILQTDNNITTNSRVWLRDGLQIHYAGVRISLRSPIWAISVTRIASGLSKPGGGFDSPIAFQMSRLTWMEWHQLTI